MKSQDKATTLRMVSKATLEIGPNIDAVIEVLEEFKRELPEIIKRIDSGDGERAGGFWTVLSFVTSHKK